MWMRKDCGMGCTVGFLPESYCCNWAEVFRDCMWTQGNEGLGFPPIWDMYEVHALWRVSSNNHINIGTRLILETLPGQSPWTSLTQQGASWKGTAYLHLRSLHLVKGLLFFFLFYYNILCRKAEISLLYILFYFLLTFDSLLFLLFLLRKDEYLFVQWNPTNTMNKF